MRIEDNGWDSRAWLDGDWLHREPRREEVRPRLLAETRLLPWLAPQLPLPVPLPEPTEYGVHIVGCVAAQRHNSPCPCQSLGPWYEVRRGLLLDLPGDVESGLKAILARL